MGAACTQNSVGATTPSLYDIDPATDSLMNQNPPHNGILPPVGPLGFDILWT